MRFAAAAYALACRSRLCDKWICLENSFHGNESEIWLIVAAFLRARLDEKVP